MYTRRRIRWSVVFRLASWQVAVFTGWSLLVTFIYLELGKRNIDCSIPIAPIGTIGVAVALYVGFKNNQAYDRTWEARKIWGGIVNTSRTWANQVLSYVSAYHSPDEYDKKSVYEVQKRLIYRHLAWITALRFQLRRKTSFGFQPTGAQRRFMQATDVDALKKQMHEFLGERELSVACTQVNSAAQILRLQGEDLRAVREDLHLVEDFRHIAMMDLMTEMYSLQGKCERIKNTPFPRQYAYFSDIFTQIFIALLPLGVVGEFATRGSTMVWLTVPVSVLISWVFYTMETVGDASEDPFENFINDVPMTALCRNIEIDLRQMLNEKDIPEKLEPVDDILM